MNERIFDLCLMALLGFEVNAGEELDQYRAIKWLADQGKSNPPTPDEMILTRITEALVNYDASTRRALINQLDTLNSRQNFNQYLHERRRNDDLIQEVFDWLIRLWA